MLVYDVYLGCLVCYVVEVVVCDLVIDFVFVMFGYVESLVCCF